MFCTRTKRIGAGVTEGMPVAYCKPQMLFHGFASYQSVLIIPFKGQWVIALHAFIPDLANAFEELFVSSNDFHISEFIIYLRDTFRL
jgi:hypothetical protein